jgi:hypothetical protein
MRGRWYWYDIIFVGLAVVIVFPDKVLGWISDRTGREFGLWHIVWLEIIAVGLIVIAMTLLMPVCPRLNWWYPFLSIGAFVLVRGIRWLVIEMLGFHDS